MKESYKEICIYFIIFMMQIYQMNEMKVNDSIIFC